MLRLFKVIFFFLLVLFHIHIALAIAGLFFTEINEIMFLVSIFYEMPKVSYLLTGISFLNLQLQHSFYSLLSIFVCFCTSTNVWFSSL